MNHSIHKEEQMTPVIPLPNTAYEMKILVGSINDLNFTLDKIADWLESINEKLDNIDTKLSYLKKEN